jgi:hypothetical protein
MLNLQGWLVDLGVPVLRLGFFFLVREAVNLLLWRTLVRRLNGETGFNVALLGSGV